MQIINSVILPEDSTIMDIVRNSAVHTLLEVVIDTSETTTIFESYGRWTLFAPVDDAFSIIDPDVLEELLDDPEALQEILGFHLVAGKVFAADLSDGMMIETVAGEILEVSIDNGEVRINGSLVVLADLEADNGVVHAVGSIIGSGESTVWDIVVESPVHNTLEAAVLAAGLDGALSDSDASITLFAPTDDAFDALPDGTVEALLMDPSGALTSILLYHVVGAEAFAGDLSDGQVITTLNGKDVVVTINADGVFINDAQVIITDLEADNGVVHVIDAVLLPPRRTITDIVVEDAELTTLEAAVVAADLAGTLSGDGPFTVFAPTDDAFAALPDGTLDALLQDPQGELTNILLYHVVGGEAFSTDLSDGQSITTINGADVTVTIDNNGVFINNAQVTVADIEADNGVIHKINTVLLPPTSTQDDNLVEAKLYPNPAKNYTHLDVSAYTKSNVNITIYNAAGSVMQFISNVSPKTDIDVSMLPSGIYYIQAVNKDLQTKAKINKIK